MNLTIPKLRTWHLLGIVAASAALISVIQFRWTTEDAGYALLRRLRSSDATIRAKSAYELGRLRPRDRRAIAPLTETLFDPDAKARAAAAQALLEIVGRHNGKKSDFEEEIGPVKAALASALVDRDPVARLAIAQSLGFLGTEPQVIVPTLLEFARDRDPRTRRQAIAILGSYLGKSEPALAAVFAAIDDEDPLIRWHAINGLAYFATVPQIAPEPVLGRVKDAIAGRSADRDQNNRRSAIMALWRLADRTKTEDPRIIPFLRDPDPQIRILTWEALTSRPMTKESPVYVPALERLLSDQDPGARQTSAANLARFGIYAESTLPTLRTLLDDPIDKVRLTAIDSIAIIEKAGQKFRSETLPAVIAELADADPAVRALAASRIEDFGPRAADAIPALVLGLADREADVRRAVASALGQLGPSAAVAAPKLAELAASDVDERVRRTSLLSRGILLRGERGDESRR